MSKFKPLLALLPLCVACGGAFQPSDTGSGGAGQLGGASSSAGDDAGGAAGLVGRAGASSGGTSHGGAASGGAPAAGANSGGASSAGAAAGGAPSAGAGGSAAGSHSGGAAGSPAADCTTLKAQYAAALQKARVCEPAAMGQCSPSSTLPSENGCGCGVLVNAKSQYTAIAKKKSDEVQAAGCNKGILCPAIACLEPTGASCSAQTMNSGTAYVCTGVFAGTN